jgi:hypothetical protein
MKYQEDVRTVYDRIFKKEDKKITQDDTSVVEIVDNQPNFIITNDTISTTNTEWRLDSSVRDRGNNFVIFSAYSISKKEFILYHVDLKQNNSIKPLHTFTFSVSNGFTRDYFRKIPLSITIPPTITRGYVGGHFPTPIKISPDSTKIYFASVIPSVGKNILDLQGNLTPLTELPAEGGIDVYWFSNAELAFGGRSTAGSEYNFPFYQVYNIHTKTIKPTKIPVGGGFNGLEPKVNSDATAYASQDVTSNSGWYCGLNILRLIIRTYPDGEEIFTLDNTHALDYRWLSASELEIKFTRAPLYKELGAQHAPNATPTTCFSEETMIYKLPDGTTY